MGDTGDGSYLTLYGYAWLGLLDRKENRFRLFQAQVPGEGPWPLSDPRGPDVAVWVEQEVPPLPHDPREVRHMALAFDQAARHVLAYERGGQVWVRQWDPVSQVFVMRGPFPGVDPFLVQDATVGYFPPDSDVLLFHLSPDRTALVMRAQRELYATPHVIETFPSPVVLDQAVALPYQIELLGSFLDALGETGVVVRSEVYPVRVGDALGPATFTAPATGAYIPVVVIQDLGTDTLGTGAFAAPTTGAYIPVVVIQDLGTEALGSGTFTAPSTGAYIPVVVVQDLGTEALATGTFTAPATGTYVLVVVVQDLTASQYTDGLGYEALGTGTFAAPTTGSYTLA
ncbi:hypothetical protein [Thermus phage P23-77]|uniref:Uncharacterized protein n=1 Tax=Thermus virus P23-77 TaxID=1714272 RepID=C8CHM6_9VIRU|nr:hypothetical protein P23-77_gp30 [Thermus phage P23-77]ACV05055.1 hypothetical protein [Thermus phage P23-77]